MKKGALLLRWMARVLSVGLVLLSAIFAVGEGPPPVLPLTIHSLMFGLLALSLVGLLLAWHYEALGAALAILGSVGFYAANLYATDFRSVPGGWVFPLLLLTSLLYIVAMILENRRGVRGLRAC